VIQLNSNATSVAYRIYSATGALLWTDSLTTNIPTGAGRFTQVVAIATESAGATQSILALDMMAFTVLSDLPRGSGGT
jgi:hypothetical protein